MAIIPVLTKNGKQTTSAPIVTASKNVIPVMTKATPVKTQAKPTPTITPITKTAPVKISKPVPKDQLKEGLDNIKVGAGVVADIAKKFTLKYLPESTKAAKELGLDPLSRKADPKKAVTDYTKGIKDSIEAAGLSLRRVFTNDTKKAPTASERVGAGLETVARTTGAIFSPITGLFKAAENIPSDRQVPVASVAKVINLAFSALGEGATAVSNKIVDTAIKNKAIPKKDGENIRQGLGEIISLAAMIVVGGKAGKAFEIKPAKMGELVEKFGTQDAAMIVTKAKELANKKASELKPGENTPEQVINHVVSNKLEKTAEGKKMLKTAVEAQKEGATITIEEPKPKPNVVNQPIADIKPGLKPSKIGKSIEQKAVDAKLTERFNETAGYTPITIKEQSARATTLVNGNLDEARAIVRGDKPLPDNLKGTALITAMEEHIKNNPNKDLAYELANSPLVSGTSAAAQELRLAAERTPDSATARLAEIKQAREEAFKQKYKGRNIKEVSDKVVKDIKSKVKVPDKYDWNSFIDQIAC